MSKSVLFQAIQFSISTLLSPILLKDRTLSGVTTPDHSRPRSYGNERVLRIPQISSITVISPSDCLLSYPGHSLWGGILFFCREAVGVFYRPSRLGNRRFDNDVLIVKRILFLNRNRHQKVSSYILWF